MQAVNLELLAPARNREIGIAAIDCGADAVYMAGPAFGARSNAGNSVAEIEQTCKYARRFGARVYVTVNTILFESELSEAFDLMEQCREAGCDAFIVQDVAIPAHFAGRKDFPPLFASTQCAIRTPRQARWLESLGMSRLILERELTLDEIKAIRKAVSADLEFFVHGALCVCYSGNCYLSEYLGGRSANRGECIQACRSRYDLEDGNGKTLVKNKALLSLKDLSLIDRLDDLVDAGITSFKIEGRLKNASYVKNTVRAYSEGLDRLILGRKGEGLRRQSYGKPYGGFVPDLGKTFNRGYTGLALDGAGKGWSSMDSATAIGEKLGKAESLERKGDTVRFRLCGHTPLHNGDGLCIITDKGVTGFRADICQGGTITAKYAEGLREGTEIYRNSDIRFEKELENRTPERLLETGVSVRIKETSAPGPGGERCEITATAECENGKHASVTLIGTFDKAENISRMKESFERQIGKKTGIHVFSLHSIECETDFPFLPASAINDLRRRLAERLEDATAPEATASGRIIPANNAQDAYRSPDIADYKANCSNSIAQAVYESRCGSKPEMAYEITHRKGAELMRSRYCIKRELGLCPRFGGRLPQGTAEPLVLVNNGRRLLLKFDCTRCEMIVTAQERT